MTGADLLGRARAYRAELTLLAFGALAGLALAEGLYRARLCTGLPGHFGRLPPRAGPATVFDRSPWTFDAVQGFAYPPGLDYHVSSIQDGRVVGCASYSVNPRGSHGPTGREPSDAALRLAFLGDSFTASPREGTTYPARVAELLEARLGRTVSATNLARDGTGILQMVDFAATADLASTDRIVLAFITDDLTRARIWRATLETGGEERILLTTSPEPRPDPGLARDVAMLDRRATPGWCAGARASGARDALAAEFEQRFERLRLENMPVRAGLFSPTRSYLLARLFTGDPFHGLQSPKPPINPRIAIDDYRQDGRFVTAARRLAPLGPRLALVHLPSDREVRAGRILLTTGQERRLYASMEAGLERHVVSLLDYMPLDGRRTEDLFLLPNDGHPSRDGLEVIALGLVRWLQPALEAGTVR